MTVTEINSQGKVGKRKLPAIEEIALILFFAGNAIDFFVDRFLTLVGMSMMIPFVLICIHVVTLAGIVVGFIKLNKQMRANSLIFLVLIAALIFVNYWMHPELGTWLSDETYGIGKVFALTGHVFAGGVMGFCVLIVQKDPDRIFRWLKVSSYLLMGFLLLMLYHRLRKGYFLVQGADGIRQTGYNMGFGYYCVFVSLFYYILWHEGKKKLYLAISAMFALMAVCFGSRGVVVSFAVFAASLFWVSMKDIKPSKKILTVVSIFLMAFGLVVFYDEFAHGIQEVLASFGIANSRTISLLTSTEDLLDSNGREGLWSLGVSLIAESFPLGYGAFGERVVVGNYVRWGYLHNAILEIVIEFGILGVIVLAFMLFKSAVLINNDSNPKWNSLFIFFFANCGMLLVSNSFWYFPYFWAAIAVGALYRRSLRKTRTTRLQPGQFLKGFQHV